MNSQKLINKNKYEHAINNAASDFADLAEEVMGDSSNAENGIS